jgi:hypothetical protein
MKKPLARTEGLVVRELPGELVVYDRQRHQAHCLNATAAQVFKLCDGRTTVGELARRLGRELDGPADEKLVWLSLERLERAHLLQERPPAPAKVGGYSRRELVRRFGLVAATLPVVATILAPTPAEAAVSGCVVHDVTPCANPGDDGRPCDECDGLLCDGICTSGTCLGGSICP